MHDDYRHELETETEHPHDHVHASHTSVLLRLKRAHGHLHKVISMLQQNRSCVDIAQQLHAVQNAVEKAKRELIQDHLDHCLEKTVGSLPAAKRKPIDEFKEITKYL
jgi:DNA-binding FrmR family transcriptional regulator